MSPAKDITGQRFGRLTAMSIAKRGTDRQVHWLTLCDCGKTSIVAGGNLRSGRQHSCGCIRSSVASVVHTVDRTGQKSGRLTVIGRSGDNKGRLAAWDCLCECGERVVISGDSLRNGHTQSCGCLIRDLNRARALDVVTYGSAHMRVRRARGRAGDLPCVDCGGTAVDWSYSRTGVDERMGMCRGVLMPYSMDPTNYDPRCRICHKTFDLADGRVAA